MRFLNKLLGLEFMEWNYVTKGLVDVWELTKTFGLELQFEAMLLESENAELAIHLGRAAHDKNILEQISARSYSRLNGDSAINLLPNHIGVRNDKLLLTILEPLLRFDMAVCTDRNPQLKELAHSQESWKMALQPN